MGQDVPPPAPARRQPLSDPTRRAVAVVERDGKVLVIRRHLDGRDYAVLPGGGIEEGETPAQAVVRELAEQCTLDGEVAELLFEGDRGGRYAAYFRVTGVEGEPVLGGEGAEHHDETNSYSPMWASPKDLDLLGLRPEGVGDLVVEALWPLRFRRAMGGDWEIIERMWQPYQHDLSELRGSTPGVDGTYRRGHLASYTPDDADAAAYLAVKGDRPVGFALVRGLEGDSRTMWEFFVVRAARGDGSARRLAEHVVRNHPGRWEIAFQEDNTAAARFWRRLGAEVLSDATEELRPVPNKPHIPPDVWLSGTVAR